MTAQSDPAFAEDPRTIHRRTLQSRLDAEQTHLARLYRDARKIPWLLLLALLAVPAGLVWGRTAAIFLVGSGYYLIWGHKGEYEQKIGELRRELSRLG
jgi:hypothetical protein